MENNTQQEIKFRRRQKPFTQTSNILIDDDKLSVQARFLYILINRWVDAPNFTMYKGVLQRHMKIKSEDTFDKYWKELKKSGYLIQYKFRNEKGRWAYEYELLESPVKPEEIKPEGSNDNPENHTPNFEGVENSPGEKTGGFNNTNLPNTDLRNTGKNREEKVNDSEDDSFLSSPALSDTEKLTKKDKKDKKDFTPVIPSEAINELDKYFIGRFKKERKFYGMNFDEGNYYMAFADALSKTLVQDNVEILTMHQYPYFIKTLSAMIKPLEEERQLLGWK